MSDDLREREPDRTRGDDPTDEGTRSDHAGTGTGSQGPAPAAGGGYGSTSEAGGSGDSEGRTKAGEDPQTEWLRNAPGGEGEAEPSDRA